MNDWIAEGIETSEIDAPAVAEKLLVKGSCIGFRPRAIERQVGSAAPSK